MPGVLIDETDWQTVGGIGSAEEILHEEFASAQMLHHTFVERVELFRFHGHVDCAPGHGAGCGFIADNETTARTVAWSAVNMPMEPEKFDALYERVMEHLRGRELFVQDLFCGADPAYRLPVRFVNEYAWHNLFVRQLFLRPTPEELRTHRPEFTVIAAPEFQGDPKRDGVNSEVFVLLNFMRRTVLIGGTSYAGEMKKSIFSIMNFLLPQRNVFPMHCSANLGHNGVSALFFGLSGTGKTTLSADPSRDLIGDDEHGWSADGVFNFEGGCYAKCIKLSKQN